MFGTTRPNFFTVFVTGFCTYTMTLCRSEEGSSSYPRTEEDRVSWLQKLVYSVYTMTMCRSEEGSSLYPRTEEDRETRGGMHSQASYWFSIGFKQMVCTVATCYWFLALLWFYKP
jgi:hypothetical protein